MCFAPVTTDSLEERLGIKLKPHPDKVAEAAALSALQPPPLKYHMALPKQILLREAFLPSHVLANHAWPALEQC
jgi:hypothetical protein